MKANLKAKRKTGAARMIELGYKQVQIWFTPLEMNMISAAFGTVAVAAVCKECVLSECAERGESYQKHLGKKK